MKYDPSTSLFAGRDLTNEAEIILADVFDEDSLNAMCSKAQIILNCVGPVS